MKETTNHNEETAKNKETKRNNQQQRKKKERPENKEGRGTQKNFEQPSLPYFIIMVWWRPRNVKTHSRVLVAFIFLLLSSSKPLTMQSCMVSARFCFCLKSLASAQAVHQNITKETCNLNLFTEQLG